MKSGGRSQKDPKHLPSLSRTYPQNLGLLPKYGGYVPGEGQPPEGGFGDWNICVCVCQIGGGGLGVGTSRYGGPWVSFITGQKTKLT